MPRCPDRTELWINPVCPSSGMRFSAAGINICNELPFLSIYYGYLVPSVRCHKEVTLG